MAKQTTTHIKNLFLDPNNYRFIDNNEYDFNHQNFDELKEKLKALK
jgi:hypothetical protein